MTRGALDLATTEEGNQKLPLLSAKENTTITNERQRQTGLMFLALYTNGFPYWALSATATRASPEALSLVGWAYLPRSSFCARWQIRNGLFFSFPVFVVNFKLLYNSKELMCNR
jgi:hypothetical protein